MAIFEHKKRKKKMPLRMDNPVYISMAQHTQKKPPAQPSPIFYYFNRNSCDVISFRVYPALYVCPVFSAVVRG